MEYSDVSSVAGILEDALKPKLLFLVTEDWYFCSHRLPIARAARNAGFDVIVSTRINKHGKAIEAEGFRFVALKSFKREVTNPWQILKEILEVVALYRQEKPELVHHVAIKPVVVGSIAARIAGIGAVVNAVAGLGFVFSSHKWRARIIRPVLKVLLRFCLMNSTVIVQNPDDEQAMISQGLAQKVKLIRGSGVDTNYFCAMSKPEGEFTVGLVSRMLWEKGSGELVEAIRILRKKGVQVRAILAGSPDLSNPNSIPINKLEEWSREEGIEWLGHVSDVRNVWSRAHVAALPSYYREGVPKCLLEAAACARPIITTDMPGCREIVQHKKTGLLVPPRDAVALSLAIQELYNDRVMCDRLGANARDLVVSEMSEKKVVEATLRVYDEVKSNIH
jgi:glycosyltransferase involved in cell wall biosynthesis